jgi:small subunit ribosomal protein S4
MGDPRKQRKKYSGPQHPWNKARIDEEKILVTEYGLKNKKELWKMTSKLSNFRKQAKSLIARKDKQGEIEKADFLKKLSKLGLVTIESSLDDVLDLSVKDLLERRLQTILFRKSFARSINQARQFIVHEHVFYDGHKLDVPSFLVFAGTEESVTFDPKSALSDPEHPERKIEEIKLEEEPVKEKKTEEVKKEAPKEEKKTEEVKKEAPKEEKKTEEVKKEVPKEEKKTEEVKKEVPKEEKKTEEVKIKNE